MSDRRWPKKLLRVQLTGEYAGFYFVWWRNAPIDWRGDLVRAVQANDDPLALRAIWRCIVEHNFVDFDGNPLPPGGELSDADLARIPGDLLGVIWSSLQNAVRDEQLPNEH
ncbi:MAG: hypothetical protein RMJ05_08015 [Thermomicrobium sp.]|nr:hypothetical protein [Thermomicrobium sp.]MDW8006653.1 hypothetical protein [Thermomicrobium sp.]